MSRTTPSRTTPTEYRYDTLGRLKEVEDIAGTAEYVYDGNGNLATVLNPNDTESNYYYDSMDRLLGTETLNASETIYSVTYSLRADGKRSDIEEHIWDGDNERVRYGGYGYDNHGRLTYEGWGCGDDYEELNYVYDDAGNRTRTWGTDENGESVDTTYTTNALDQLRSETEDGNTTYYAYDANGNLCAKGTGIADATTTPSGIAVHPSGGGGIGKGQKEPKGRAGHRLENLCSIGEKTPGNEVRTASGGRE